MKFGYQPFNPRTVVEKLTSDGAVALPMIGPAALEALQLEAKKHLAKRKTKKGAEGAPSMEVYCSTPGKISHRSLYYNLAETSFEFLDSFFAQLPAYPFTQRLWFRTEELRQYLVSSSGTTFQALPPSAVNLRAIFRIQGESSLFVAEDDTGTGAKEIPVKPGDVVLIRAPGFKYSDEKVHIATDPIIEGHTEFVLDQY